MSVKRVKTSYSLPTKDEQLQLRETQNLMSSNMLQMQISEMIIGAKYDSIPRKKTKAFEMWLSGFKVELENSLFELENSTLTSTWVSKMEIPLCLENFGGVQTSIVLKKPEKILVFGSHVLKTSIQPHCCVDLAIVMPKCCFEKR